MRSLLLILGLVAALPLISPVVRAQAPPPQPAAPLDFDSRAPMPKNLPAKLNIPPNTRIEVSAWSKGVNPALPPDSKNLSLLWDPHLISAVIESNDRDAHAILQWEGGRSSEAYLIRGSCFRLTCLAYPQLVSITSSALDFWISSQDPDAGNGGSFPGASWYSPSHFAGTASINGGKVLVFAPSKNAAEKNSQGDAYPDGLSLCLDSITFLPLWLKDGKSTYTFTYLPAHDVQINPQGFYLKAIVAKFGRYP